VTRRKPTLAALLRPLSAKTVRPRRSGRSVDDPALNAIWSVVCAIPRGRVSTYGAVARAAGLPGRARQAGYALRVAPRALHLPWHRVVGAGGRIAFPKFSAHYTEQTRRLRAEGVGVRDGRVAPEAITELGEP
jgi:methylated-DNA-protein-cysteine methyltransferase related protein